MKRVCPDCGKEEILRWIGNLRWQCIRCGCLVKMGPGDERIEKVEEK